MKMFGTTAKKFSAKGVRGRWFCKKCLSETKRWVFHEVVVKNSLITASFCQAGLKFVISDLDSIQIDPYIVAKASNSVNHESTFLITWVARLCKYCRYLLVECRYSYEKIFQSHLRGAKCSFLISLLEPLLHTLVTVLAALLLAVCKNCLSFATTFD